MPKSRRSKQQRRRRKGTSVVFPDGQVVVFQQQLTRAVAIRRALKARKVMQNPVSDPVEHALKKFEEFNWKPATELRKLKVDLKTPLIRIGKVPEIHYMSDKEGALTHYVHFTKRQPTLYGHPDGGLFVMAGGSTVINDWLEENPAQAGSGRLIQANIDKAKQRYEELSPEAKSKVQDVSSWVYKVAWQIQRGRMKQFGHK